MSDWLERQLQVPRRPSAARIVVLLVLGNAAYCGFLLVLFWAATAYGRWEADEQSVPGWTWRFGVALMIGGTAAALLALLTAPRSSAPITTIETKPWTALLIVETVVIAIVVAAVADQSRLRWVPLVLAGVASTVLWAVRRQP